MCNQTSILAAGEKSVASCCGLRYCTGSGGVTEPRGFLQTKEAL